MEMAAENRPCRDHIGFLLPCCQDWRGDIGHPLLRLLAEHLIHFIHKNFTLSLLGAACSKALFLPAGQSFYRIPYILHQNILLFDVIH